jgi:hypothetical protein
MERTKEFAKIMFRILVRSEFCSYELVRIRVLGKIGKSIYEFNKFKLVGQSRENLILIRG